MAGKISQSGGGSGGATDEMPAISEINVTPFVDVVLVLLVIFMVTAPMLVREQMAVNLPKAESGEKSASQAVAIVISKEGSITIMQKPVPLEQVEATVKELMAKNPASQAVISADQDTHHGDVVKVMDMLKKAGLNKFSIQIERK